MIEFYSIIKKDFLISKYKNQIQIKDISSEIFNLNILININVFYLIYKNIYSKVKEYQINIKVKSY